MTPTASKYEWDRPSLSKPPMLASVEQGWYKSRMKLFIALVFIVGSYLGFLFYTTDTVLGQAKQLNVTYQYVANNADRIATGSSSSN